MDILLIFNMASFVQVTQIIGVFVVQVVEKHNTIWFDFAKIFHQSRSRNNRSQAFSLLSIDKTIRRDY